MMNDLLMNVMMLDFAVQDAALFIDTHPNDEEAMHYFHEASTRLNEASKQAEDRRTAKIKELLESMRSANTSSSDELESGYI